MAIKGPATLFDKLFPKTGRRHPEHRDNGEYGSAGGNFDHDVTAQLPERTVRRLLACFGGERGRKPKPIDRREREHAEEQRDLDQQEMAVAVNARALPARYHVLIAPVRRSAPTATIP
jgi:hypothetical protein